MAQPLPPLASIAELAAITGRSEADQNLVASLRAASRRFRGDVGHNVSLTTLTAAELDGSASRMLPLPGLPVVSVASLTENGVALALGTDYELSKRAAWARRLGPLPWTRALGGIVITFTYGYDATPPDDDADDPTLAGVPGDIQAAVLQMAQTLINVIPGLQQKTVLNDTVIFGATATVGVTQDWADAVASYSIGRGDRA